MPSASLVAVAPGAVLFDWDNTLIDGWAAIAAGMNAVFARRHMPPWTAADAQTNVRGSARESFPAMFGPGWEDDAALFYATLAEVHLLHLRPLAGAARLLETCCGMACAVVSNKAGEVLRREVAHLGWEHHFAAIVGAGDAAADKPDAAPLLLALQRIGRSPGPTVWYVGDTALDMRAARAAGCRAVLVGDAAHDGGLASARPDMHCRDRFQLADEIAALAL